MPRRKETYAGEVWTDARGYAAIVLPEQVGRDGAAFDVALTAVGDARAEVRAGRLTVETDEPHVKVAWRLEPCGARRPRLVQRLMQRVVAVRNEDER
jgi:hypothetical protein